MVRMRKLDLFGFSASALCALHCAALPFLVNIAQMASLGFLFNPLFEFTFILISMAIAALSIIPSYLKHHHNLFPLIMMLMGLVLLGLSRIIFLEEHVMEIVLTVMGACLIAISHIVNWKLINKSIEKNEETACNRT
jgi:hypothetical protein